MFFKTTDDGENVVRVNSASITHYTYDHGANVGLIFLNGSSEVEKGIWVTAETIARLDKLFLPTELPNG